MTLRSRNQVLLTAFIFVPALLNISGFARGPSSDTAQSTATSAATPANITANHLKKLLWLEGTWRGTGDVETPFYERYRFENDKTLIVEGLADESLSKVTDTTRFDLKNGQFGNGGDTRWVATEVADNYITFSMPQLIRVARRRAGPATVMRCMKVRSPVTCSLSYSQRGIHKPMLGSFSTATRNAPGDAIQTRKLLR